MKNRLAIHQINRKRKREKEKKHKKLRLGALGLFLVIALAFIIKPHIVGDKKASADSASLLSTQIPNQREYASSGARKANQQLANIPQTNELAEKQGFTDELLSYKKTSNQVGIYQEMSIEGKKIMDIKPGTYIKYYGMEDGWSKVMYQNITGYVKSENLLSVKENELTVRKGVLYVGTDNIIPSDFETSFDVNTENSLLVAIEAMRREGLSVSVGRKYTTFEQEKEYITNNTSEYPYPDEYTSELRTGYALELHSEKTDPRIQNNFFSTKEGEWIKENIHKYGFILRYPQGKEDITKLSANEHIYRFVGVEHAKAMYEQGLTMEEYFK